MHASCKRLLFLPSVAALLSSTPCARAQKLTGPVVRIFLTCPQVDMCITFDRQEGDTGVIDQAWPSRETAARRIIASSKILFSGTLLRVNTANYPPASKPTNYLPPIKDCRLYEWFVVTQARESSSVLIYNPVDIGSEFCDVADPVNSPNVGNKTWLYIPLPVHVMWAEITGYRIARGDSFHKPPAPLPNKPPADACTVDKPDDPVLDPANLRPCDRNDWPQRWFYRTGAVYNPLTQPGTGQGAISYTPVIGSGSLSFSYDVQANPTIHLGAGWPAKHLGFGWLGFPVVFEKSANQSGNLDSLTIAAGYEIHPEPGGNIFPARSIEKNVSPVSLRAAELQVRTGFELAPTTPHDLNTLQAAALKMPLVFAVDKQPSGLTLYPLFGIERVHHVYTHKAGESSYQTRELAGGDASFRWPWSFAQSFFGDKPVTIDFAYRYRWLSHPEPTSNYQAAAPKTTPPEFLSAESHSYTRASYNAPFSSFLSFKITVQHGSLPPDFRSLGYTLQLGLSFSDPGSSEH
jgi:hypothetical protein